MNFVDNFSDITSTYPSLPTRDFGEAWEAFKARFDVSDTSHDAHTFFRVIKDALSPYSVTSRLDWFLVPSSVHSPSQTCLFGPSGFSSHQVLAGLDPPV